MDALLKVLPLMNWFLGGWSDERRLATLCLGGGLLSQAAIFGLQLLSGVLLALSLLLGILKRALLGGYDGV